MNATYKKEYLSNICSNLLKSYHKKLQESEKNRKDNQERLSKIMEMETKSMMASQEKNRQEMNNFYQQEQENRQWCRENRQPFISSIPPHSYQRHHSMIEYSTEYAATSNSNIRTEALYEKISKLEEMQSIFDDENSSDIILDDNDIRLLEL